MFPQINIASILQLGESNTILSHNIRKIPYWPIL